MYYSMYVCTYIMMVYRTNGHKTVRSPKIKRVFLAYSSSSSSSSSSSRVRICIRLTVNCITYYDSYSRVRNFMHNTPTLCIL